MYYSLADHIFAAPYQESIIILNLESDTYVSLIDEAAVYLKQIIGTSVSNEHDQSFQEWVTFFLEQNYIVQSMLVKNISPLPLKEGGLKEYQWDHKPSWKPFARTKKTAIIGALFCLARVHRTLKKSGIQGVMRLLDASRHTDLLIPTSQEIERLATTLDAATMIYPKKTVCLAWAATFALLARAHGWKCDMVIGVQASPFYAHAWAEINGVVIHDDPEIAQVLSIILSYPLDKRK